MTLMRRIVLLCGFSISAFACENTFQLPGLRIESAETVPAAASLPEFCQVKGYVVTPGLQGEPDNKVNFEVDLPTSGWNGKLFFAGGSGFIGGRPNKAPMSKGYATAYTDTGHDAASAVDATWALNSMTRKADFFDRGIHVGTVAAKAVTQAFYEKKLEKSYFAGCSTGGKQAFIEAQRYPEDFDGIVAGAPAVDYTGLMIEFNWNERALLSSPEAYIPASKLPLIAKAVLAHCDAQDGLADGLIGEPRKCDFDPATLLCRAGDGAHCLTAPQVDTLRKLYAGPGKTIFPGMPIGHEDSPNYAAYIFGNLQPALLHGTLLTFPGDYIQDAAAAPYDFAFQREFFRYLAFHPGDANYDWRSFNPEKDLPKIAVLGKMHNAVDADLSRFKKHGGRMIIYNGWADPVVPPVRIIDYYEKVQSAMGDPRSFARLFLAPGMNHCGGGPGPNAFDSLGALEKWVEHGEAPDRIVASHATDRVVDRTRPLCPYPQVAKYKGSGSIDDASNFACAVSR
jgi:pimeloyl-ACP methyl ester carboxylesterase